MVSFSLRLYGSTATSCKSVSILAAPGHPAYTSIEGESVTNARDINESIELVTASGKRTFPLSNGKVTKVTIPLPLHREVAIYTTMTAQNSDGGAEAYMYLRGTAHCLTAIGR
jgi:hypothetical protein